MRLPVIRSFTEFIEQHGTEKVEAAIEVLEHTAEMRGMKDEELEAVGEIISNLIGALQVTEDVKSGTSRSDALNNFMKRVLGSIDK